MATYLVNWNSKPTNWRGHADDCERTRRGRPVHTRWLTGGTKSIHPGDRIIVGRQGAEPRGVIASGYATSDYYEEPHDDGSGRLATVNDICLDSVLAPHEVLPKSSMLRGPVRRILWESRKSGIRIDDEAAAALEIRWAEHLQAIGFASEGESRAVELFGREGKLKVRIHHHRERCPALVAALKRSRMDEQGRLACEVCDFDFSTAYGEHGDGFIEAHHRVPVSKLNPDRGAKVRLSDLALVCANCHRMLHRGRWPSMEELRGIVQGAGRGTIVIGGAEGAYFAR